MVFDVGSGRTVVDFGSHFFPSEPPEVQELHDFVTTQQGVALHTDVEALVERYEAAGVDGAALSQSVLIGSGDLDRVRTANDALLDVVRDREHFYALAAIPTAAGGEAAAEEFERCLERGYNGGAIETKSDGIEVHHDEVEPILAVAEEWGAPLMVHPKISESLHPDALDDEWHLNALFGREIALSESLFKVVHDGVLDRHPDLDLVYHHLGGNIASMLGRLDGELAPGRWPDNPRLKPHDEFRAQVEERIYLDTCGFYGDPSAFQATLRAFPADHLLFATDFPYETRTPEEFQTIVETIEKLTPESGTRRILGENALDLFVNVD